jgi:hypothetical protein
MAKGKKLTTTQLKAIVSRARTIRSNAGSRKVTRTETKYSMKWTEAISRAAKQVLHPAKQTKLKFKK